MDSLIIKKSAKFKNLIMYTSITEDGVEFDETIEVGDFIHVNTVQNGIFETYYGRVSGIVNIEVNPGIVLDYSSDYNSNTVILPINNCIKIFKEKDITIYDGKYDDTNTIYIRNIQIDPDEWVESLTPTEKPWSASYTINGYVHINKVYARCYDIPEYETTNYSDISVEVERVDTSQIEESDDNITMKTSVIIFARNKPDMIISLSLSFTNNLLHNPFFDSIHDESCTVTYSNISCESLKFNHVSEGESNQFKYVATIPIPNAEMVVDIKGLFSDNNIYTDTKQYFGNWNPGDTELKLYTNTLSIYNIRDLFTFYFKLDLNKQTEEPTPDENPTPDEEANPDEPVVPTPDKSIESIDDSKII